MDGDRLIDSDGNQIIDCLGNRRLVVDSGLPGHESDCLECCGPPECWTLYSSPLCGGPATLYTSTDMTLWIGKVFTIAGRPECWTVEAGCPQGVGTVAVSGMDEWPSCDTCKCFSLTDCKGIEAMRSTDTPLGLYVGKVIQIAGSDVCWRVTRGCSGGIPHVAVVVVNNYNTCELCAPPIDCICPGHPPLLNAYQVTGAPITKAFSDPVTGCLDPLDSTANPWNGVVNVGTNCAWKSPYDVVSWNGKSFGASDPVSLRFSTSTCRWHLLLIMGASGTSPGWYGTKATGTTPVGTYISDWACQVPQTLVVS